MGSIWGINSVSSSAVAPASVYALAEEKHALNREMDVTKLCIHFAVKSLLNMMSKSDMPSLLLRSSSDVPLCINQFDYEVTIHDLGYGYYLDIELSHDDVDGRYSLNNIVRVPWFRDFVRELMNISRSFVSAQGSVMAMYIAVSLNGCEIKKELVAQQ